MPSPIEQTAVEDPNPYSNRCITGCGILCIVVATLFFFGNISMIVWLFEYNYPVKFSVICFMAASGVLYLTSFTSSLLLITRGFPSNKRSTINASEATVAGVTQYEGTQENYEMTTNISYREDPNLLQLPQKMVVRKTPPPPYEAPANGSTTRDHSISEHEMGQVQSSTQTLDNDILSMNRRYYELERNVHSSRELIVPQLPIRNRAPIQTETSPKLIVSLDESPSSSNDIKEQRASNYQLLQQAQEQASSNVSQSSFRDRQQGFLQASTNSESSPRPCPKVVVTSDLSPSSSIEMKRLVPLNSPRPAQRVNRNPSTAVKRKLKTRMSMSQSDLDSETLSGNSPSNSNAEMPTSHSNFNLDGSLQVSKSNWNAQVQTSQSNLNPVFTPRFLRRNAEVRASQSNLKPAITPRTSQSNLNVEVQKSLPNSNPESKHPESHSNLNTGRQQFASKSNWLLPTDKRFTSHSNLNADQQSLASQSHSTSEAPHRSSQANINSNSSLASSNISNNINTKLQVKNLKKIYQPEQFVARSKDAPSLHKAHSFGSLIVSASKSPQLEATELKTDGERYASANNYNYYVPGRSTESVLDASRNDKQMTPPEWMSAWNRGFQKRSTDPERIVGVRL